MPCALGPRVQRGPPSICPSPREEPLCALTSWLLPPSQPPAPFREDTRNVASLTSVAISTRVRVTCLYIERTGATHSKVISCYCFQAEQAHLLIWLRLHPVRSLRLLAELPVDTQLLRMGCGQPSGTPTTVWTGFVFERGLLRVLMCLPVGWGEGGGCASLVYVYHSAESSGRSPLAGHIVFPSPTSSGPCLPVPALWGLVALVILPTLPVAIPNPDQRESGGFALDLFT